MLHGSSLFRLNCLNRFSYWSFACFDLIRLVLTDLYRLYFKLDAMVTLILVRILFRDQIYWPPRTQDENWKTTRQPYPSSCSMYWAAVPWQPGEESWYSYACPRTNYDGGLHLFLLDLYKPIQPTFFLICNQQPFLIMIHLCSRTYNDQTKRRPWSAKWCRCLVKWAVSLFRSVSRLYFSSRMFMSCYQI